MVPRRAVSVLRRLVRHLTEAFEPHEDCAQQERGLRIVPYEAVRTFGMQFPIGHMVKVQSDAGSRFPIR